jgi:hypothetical protein
MKNNFFNLFVISLLLCSCGSEIKSYKVAIYFKQPLNNRASESNVNCLNQLRNFIPKFENNGTIYICKSADFFRLDIDSNGKMETKHTIANEIKVTMGVELSSEDLLNDYQDSNNIFFPSILNNPTGLYNNAFPSDCILLSDIDSLKLIILSHIESNKADETIKIGLIPLNKSQISLDIIDPDQTERGEINIKESSETITTDDVNDLDAPRTPLSQNLPKLRINLEVSDDEKELKWYHNSKKSQTEVTYEVVVYKNKRQIISKKNINSNSISCSELNDTRVLNTDCEYQVQIKAFRALDGMVYSETYDIELLSPDKFTPRCHLNLLNE